MITDKHLTLFNMNEDLLDEDEPTLKETEYWKRNAAGLIDAAIVIALFAGATQFVPQHILNEMQGPVTPGLYVLLLLALYRLFSMLLFDGTTGMRICSIVLLNEDGESLSAKEKLLAAFFILINGVGYYDKS